MELKDKKVGLGITGSFCNFNRIQEIIQNLKNEGATVIPIITETVRDTTTKFYEKEDFIKMLQDNTGNVLIDTITKAEPIGPKNMLDILLICPCTGNTAAKLANGITDSAVLMAAKSHIRNNKPIVIGISTNDGLGHNLKNIAELLNSKNTYFVPFNQDDYNIKPKSLVLNYDQIIDTLKYALDHKQIQPIISLR
ncbi:MAG: dipicolinic acid synthetase, subunit [Clostridia bacterium]|jgi:dipicolinate synthase subunit B|nr:dipicolinic acid synthetase, subunit [Clostridia bacterium]